MSRGTFMLCLLASIAVTFSRSANVPTERFETSQEPFDGNVYQSDLLPGRYVSVDQQCKDRGSGYYYSFCKVEDPAELCQELKCASSRGDIPAAEESGPALDGTWCGDNKMCFEGSCIDDTTPPENPLKVVGGEFCEE